MRALVIFIAGAAVGTGLTLLVASLSEGRAQTDPPLPPAIEQPDDAPPALPPGHGRFHRLPGIPPPQWDDEGD